MKPRIVSSAVFLYLVCLIMFFLLRSTGQKKIYIVRGKQDNTQGTSDILYEGKRKETKKKKKKKTKTSQNFDGIDGTGATKKKEINERLTENIFDHCFQRRMHSTLPLFFGPLKRDRYNDDSCHNDNHSCQYRIIAFNFCMVCGNTGACFVAAWLFVQLLLQLCDLVKQLLCCVWCKWR